MEYTDFFKRWGKIYHNKLFENSDNHVFCKNIIKLDKTLLIVKKILDYALTNKTTYFSAIKALHLTKCRNKFYDYLFKIEILESMEYVESLFLKSTRPKNINYFYHYDAKKAIADAYYIYHMNMSNIFMNFRELYPKLSLKTVCKIINNDERNTRKQTREFKIKHPLRTWNIEFGNLQMDLKIIGAKQSPTGKRITVFDAKDEQSKLYYMQVIANQTKSELLNATHNMLDYFQNIGLKILRIRTDNAMVFKENNTEMNFVKMFEFSELLKSMKIKHEHIPLGQPQCNGVIERQHKILDKEFVPHIRSCDTLETLKKTAHDFMQNFNFKRYHYYSFLTKCREYKSFTSRFKIPINFLNTAIEHDV